MRLVSVCAALGIRYRSAVALVATGRAFTRGENALYLNLRQRTTHKRSPHFARLGSDMIVQEVILMAKSGKKNGSGPSPNDNRSNVMNPNSTAYKAARDNRANQMNPTHPAYNSSRSGQPLPAEPSRSPNDQRSDALNPNSAANKAVRDNRANQMNPTHPAYNSSRATQEDE